MNNQISNINTLLQLQRSSIAAIYEDIKTRFMAEAKFKLLNERTINDLSRLTLEISEIDLLFVAVQQLVNGQLPQFLIPHQDLQRDIDHFKEFLQTNYPELQLYREDLYYYYKHVKFNVIQVRNSIIMILHVPLQHKELSYELDIYRLHKIPLAVPGSSTDFTMLSSNFYAIAYNKDADYYITFESVYDMPSDLLDLRHSNVILQLRNNNTSCALRLMEGNLDDIKRFCGYNIQRKALKPAGYRLSEHAILLSNISVIRISCTNFSKTSTMDKIQVVFFLRCGCKLLAGDSFLQSSFQVFNN